ncbi:AI-2E family transporter [Ihubacter sp. rT4E-8]|uniref:AI-2E family transporter n=1 Tax=unclassified Ihubacter TaxID=2633299 RepID=UPI00137B2428
MLKWIIAIFILSILFILRQALIPLAIGVAIAAILDPYVEWITKKLAGRRLAAVFLAYATVLSAVVLIIFGFADLIAGRITSGSLQEAISTLRAYYLQYKSALANYLGFSLKAPDLGRLLQSLGNAAARFFVGMVAGVYLLLDKAYFLRLGNKIMHLFLNQKVHGIVRELLLESSEVISAFLRGIFIDSVIVAFLSSLALTLLDVDFAVFIGCFAGIANIIPYFGPALGMIPAAASAYLSAGLTKAILAAAALFAIQQAECNYIYPKIIGHSTGLHPLFVLAAVSAAAYSGGIFAMILAVPAAGILKVLLCKWAETQ